MGNDKFEVDNNIDESLKDGQKGSLKSYLISLVLVKNIVAAFFLVLAVLFIVDMSIKFYTDHGKVHEVPNLVGLNIQQVDSVLNLYEMRSRIIDSVFLYEQEPGIVISHSPKFQDLVKKNRTINVVINAYYRKKIPMPDFTNVSITRLQKLIYDSKLVLGKIMYRPHIAKDIIIQQLVNSKTILPNTIIEEGTVVDVVVGSGIGRIIVGVPHLVGMKLNKLKKILNSVALNLGAVVKDKTISADIDGNLIIVKKQYPSYSPNATIRQGSEIDVWVTKDTTNIE